MTTNVLKTEADYTAARQQAERLVALDPVPGTKEADELELLALVLSDYEAKHFPLSSADPIEAIRFRMEQMGLVQQDLVRFIGSKSKVSEVLAGKRRLTLPMIRALSAGLGIPLRVLVQGPETKSSQLDAAPDSKLLPIEHMARHGYFGAQRTSKELRDSAGSLVRQFLAPLGSRPIYVFTKQSHHVRSGRTFDQYGLFAWTAQVMRKALAQKLATTYRAGSIDDEFMRQVAQLSWSSQGPVLAREFLAQHGISLVIERHLPKTYLDGAALLVDADRPVIGMTLRYDRLDNFWHCLMHELAHVRVHLQQPEDRFYDDLDPTEEDDPREIEADELAQESLVAREMWEDSAAHDLRSAEAAISLAKKLHVHPAVVAGRMRFESRDFKILTSLLGNGAVRRLFPEFQEATGA